MKKLQKELIALVKKWEQDKVDVREVHEVAEELYVKFETKDLVDKSEPESIPIEVLRQLEILNHQLITKEDIPVIKSFLMTPRGEELISWKKWENYWNNLDFEHRKKKLRNNHYYIT